jgi:pSer/pThr/pTyr-binding forkhead associated (FHA) protein
VRCLACADRPVSDGLLCEPCAATLRGKHAICAEQITCQVDGTSERAGLMDEWGRVHALATATAIGRQAVAGGLSIAEPSVSRRHAELHRVGNTWEVRDLGSSNGTTVNGKRIDRKPVEHGDVIAFGHVRFIFVSDVPAVQNRSFQAAMTVKPAAAPPSLYEDDVIEETFSGLRSADLTFCAPSGGGGGVLEIDGRSVQLTLIQLELFQVLARRMMDEAGRDERVRGFVRSSELLATLPWDTPKPEDNHMKQLVRRVRRALSRAGIPDIIESRHGFGYRLCVLPNRRPE